MLIRNDSGETIPAFGILRITGTVLLKGKPAITVDKPDDLWGEHGQSLVNGPYPISAGQYGQAQAGPLYSVYFDTSDSATPAVGELWGPVSGEWKAKKHAPGLLIVGLPEAGDQIVLCVTNFAPVPFRTSAAHAAGATQAVNLCDADFVELSPVQSVDAVNDLYVEIPDDTKIYISRFAGKWRIVSPYIEPDDVEVKIGKADFAITKGTSGSVTVWEGEPGSEITSAGGFMAYALARDIEANKFVVLTRMPGNTGWYVDCWEE